MQAKAEAKFIRMSPRKTRLVVNLVRGMSIEQARLQLQFSTKAAAKPVLKVLNSAVANLVNNQKGTADGLVIAQAFVNPGPVIHRVTPRAQGRATPIRKRMSHITIVVSNDAPVEKVAKKAVK